MPELPEVEGVVQALKPKMEGRTIRQVQLSDVVRSSFAAGKQCIVKQAEPDVFETALTQMTITKIQRRAKYIFFHLLKDDVTYVLVSHLGMTGAWFVVNAPEEINEAKFQKHIHATFQLADGGYLIYSDIRRFGELRFLTTIEEHSPLTKIAPEPFEDGAYAYFLAKSLLPKYAKKAVKEVIMDGQVISGCGNIYATEALFAQKIHPARKIQELEDGQKQALFEEIVVILRQSIEAGGSTISDYRNINGEAGNMQNRLQMYGKKLCPTCGVTTGQMTIGGRTSVFCPQCQR
ncbi:bifunctional DNA-formamidopyrimidine glycosylase/DNA-(apurinic or apyrimidinic site) lyase [Lysinibacillus piscis]|uniref:Bifunctional DNA-formamidopyrimidine glycosylase/DNA-(Apurinic or apyrimidinic site) lyase n=1 Tax=Lysinibacillus piscis TaxID=2518931 RepID=A0ABQ5NJX3_9BACI|nr:bifunctional DNA-formamidopyrimidine glycosylase/DNA-(apurinic or apyrimidinic site) lyase [Lysinibacillus sp. KH24]GLC88324.1 bifunctional DNA-formamidopyrimidine glycosylase/DNA-(apurinic or apyrimidinic site) lyase [Lysinibacillus sp. KH24]